jgi:membrane associated rhomboid family serine protease
LRSSCCEVDVLPAPRFWRELQARLGRGVAGLLATLVGVHVVMMAARGTHAGLTVYAKWLALSWPNLLEGRLWTLLTYGLLHDLFDPLHVLFNAIALYYFGPAYERRVGTAAFLRFFGVSVVCGGVLQMGVNLVTGSNGLMVGASAGVMGLMAAWAWANPDARLLLFFVVPVAGRWALPVILGIDGFMAMSGSNISFWGHLGGVAGAWLSLRRLTQPRILAAHLRGLLRWGRKRGGGRRGPYEVLPGGRDDDPRKWN